MESGSNVKMTIRPILFIWQVGHDFPLASIERVLDAIPDQFIKLFVSIRNFGVSKPAIRSLTIVP